MKLLLPEDFDPERRWEVLEVFNGLTHPATSNFPLPLSPDHQPGSLGPGWSVGIWYRIRPVGAAGDPEVCLLGDEFRRADRMPECEFVP